MSDDHESSSDEGAIPGRLLDRVEDIFHLVLTIMLFGVAIGALVMTFIRLFSTVPFFPNGMIQAINDILFIVIILEIARTVIARFKDGFFQLSRFLIIGVIASIRHILSVGSSLTLSDNKSQEAFERGIIELGVNSGIVLALILGIFLTRKIAKSNSHSG